MGRARWSSIRNASLSHARPTARAIHRANVTQGILAPSFGEMIASPTLGGARAALWGFGHQPTTFAFALIVLPEAVATRIVSVSQVVWDESPGMGQGTPVSVNLAPRARGLKMAFVSKLLAQQAVKVILIALVKLGLRDILLGCQTSVFTQEPAGRARLASSGTVRVVHVCSPTARCTALATRTAFATRDTLASSNGLGLGTWGSASHAKPVTTKMNSTSTPASNVRRGPWLSPEATPASPCPLARQTVWGFLGANARPGSLGQ